MYTNDDRWIPKELRKSLTPYEWSRSELLDHAGLADEMLAEDREKIERLCGQIIQYRDIIRDTIDRLYVTGIAGGVLEIERDLREFMDEIDK